MRGAYAHLHPAYAQLRDADEWVDAETDPLALRDDQFFGASNAS